MAILFDAETNKTFNGDVHTYSDRTRYAIVKQRINKNEYIENPMPLCDIKYVVTKDGKPVEMTEVEKANKDTDDTLRQEEIIREALIQAKIGDITRAEAISELEIEGKI